MGLILLCTVLCFGKASLKKQQYDFLNWYIANSPDKIKDLSNLLERFDNFAYDDKRFAAFQIIDGDYSKIPTTDQQFLKKQISENDKIENLDTNLISYIGWKIKTRVSQYPKQTDLKNATPLSPIPQASRTEMLFQKLELKLPATTISLPIFTKDGNIAFINRTYNCGMLCASGGIEIYKKINGKWSFYKYLNQWIS